MPVEERTRFVFTSTALADDTFTVVQFKGVEAISRLYEFEIILDAEDPEIDLKEVLKNPVCLTIERDGEPQRTIHGILARFEQLHEYSEHIYYRAVLVPNLWLADQHHENQLFLDKSVPDVIEEILKQAGLTANDYELKLTAAYPAWEYICQYNETDFNFICRWMEREGIYYYFEQTDEAEKLIITDSSTAHQDIEGESIRYSPPDSLIPTVREQVREFTCRQQMLPQKVVLKDYNYRKPSLDLKGEADVDSEGRGNVYIYGEHFKTPEEGNALASIRAEELLCREVVFHGEGTVPPFLPGFIFELHDHYRDSYNQRYLITELHHEGAQANYLTSNTPPGADEGETTPSYFNRFVCIPADIQFRPERVSEKPRFSGTLNARVDAAGDGQYAEIDDEGRYKVTLPFDQSGNQDGKASRWMRMSQPYAGADYGMHFPLHKGTEVLLTFVDGDPDRPIIAGTVPNPETGSPVTGGNQTQSVIRTAGGNQIRIEDNNGGQQIHMSSPTQNSIISLGDVNEGNLFLRSNGTWVSDIGENSTTRIGGDSKLEIAGDDEQIIDVNQGIHIKAKQVIKVDGDREKTITGKEKNFLNGGQDTYVHGGRIMQVSSGGDKTTIHGGQVQEVHGDRTITIHGKESRTIDADEGLNYGNSSNMTCGFKNELFLGEKGDVFIGNENKLNVALVIDLFMGLKFALNASATIEVNAGFRGGRSALKAEQFDAKITAGTTRLQKAAIYLFA